MSAKPGELAGRTPKEKNKISRRNICSAENAGGVLLYKEKMPQPNLKLFFTIVKEVQQMLNLSSGLLLSTLGGDVCGLHRLLWGWSLGSSLLCALLCHVDRAGLLKVP